MTTMRVNGLLRKSQLLSKMGTAHAEYEDKWAPQEKWHAPVARSHGTLPWHAPPARARPQSPRAPKPEIIVENTFSDGLRLKT